MDGRARPRARADRRSRHRQESRRAQRRDGRDTDRPHRQLRRLAPGARLAQLERARLRNQDRRSVGGPPRPVREDPGRHPQDDAGGPEAEPDRRDPGERRPDHDAGRRRPLAAGADAGCTDRSLPARGGAAADLPLHLHGQPPGAGGMERSADHPSDDASDRRHPCPAGHLPLPHLRRRHLRRRHDRRAGPARTGRGHRLHHGGGPLGQRLYRRARLHEDARGSRRATHHGFRPDRSAGTAAHHGARHRRADPHIPWLDGRALRRRAGRLAVRRHQPRHLPCPPARCRVDPVLRGRHDQGTIHGRHHRPCCLHGRTASEGKRRVARHQDHRTRWSSRFSW